MRQRGVRLRAEAGAGEPELEREADEPLLRAVVEISFEPPPLGVPVAITRARDARRSSSCARDLRLQPLVLERQAGCCRDLLDETRVVEQAWPVREQRDLLSLADERSHLTR